MVKVPKTASLHEKTVQKVASNAIMSYPSEPRKRTKRPRNSRVHVRMWTEGLDDMLVHFITVNRIHPSCIEIVSPTEIIIREKQ